jgi:hypothetical protein
MTGLIDRLAARVGPDRSTVRPRPDAVLLAQLGAGEAPAAEPVGAHDERPTGRAPQRRTSFAAPDGTVTHPADTAPPDRIAPPAPAAPAPRPDQPGSRPPARPEAAAPQPRQPATTARPASPARPPTASEPAALPPQPRRPTDSPAENPAGRPLTARPTRAPAAAPTHRGTTPAAGPIPMPVARPDGAAARRVHAEQRRDRTENAAPVEITIDRIDVRVPSAPPPPRPPRSATREPMSLERYLDMREQQRRRAP